jgi:hypothetical protein
MRLDCITVIACFAFLATGCGASKVPPSEKRQRTISPEFEDYLRNATVRQLMEDVRTKNTHEKVSLRWEVNELCLRGLPVFLEIADYFLDENDDVRRAVSYVIAEVSQEYYGFTRSSGWPEGKRQEWEALWVSGPFNGGTAETALERESLVKKWKQWYIENVQRRQ